MTTLNVDHVYILVHPVHEKDRFTYLQQHITSKLPSSQYTYITPFWKGKDNAMLITKNINPNKPVRQRLTEGAGFLLLTYYKIMSLFLKSDADVVLVLESDVQIHENWIEECNASIADWKKIDGWKQSMVFCGNGCNLQAPSTAKRQGRLVLMNSSKCTDSMLWSKENIRQIFKDMFPIIAPIDWFFNYWFADHPTHQAYWLEPTIFEQGSQNGTYSSEVQY